MKLKSQIDSQIFFQDKKETVFADRFTAWVKKNISTFKNKEDWFSTDIDRKTKAIQLWQKKLFNSGWMCVSWPKEFGGQSLPLHYEQIVADVLARFNAPYCCNYPAIQAVGKMILDHGDLAQKIKFIKPIISGDLQCCICFTEEKHGINFSQNETFVQEDQGKFILNGRKIWSSHSPFSDYAVVMANTQKNESPEFATAMFLVDLNKSGVQRNPFQLTNDEFFYGEVIFENVELDKTDILGTLTSGWLILSTTWMNEAHAPFDIPLRLSHKKLHQEALRSDYLSDEALDAIIHAEAIRMMSYLELKDPTSADLYRINSPLLKVAYTECIQKIAELGKDYADSDITISAIKNGQNWDYLYLSSKGESIARAPNEVHKNYITKMFLKPKL